MKRCERAALVVALALASGVHGGLFLPGGGPGAKAVIASGARSDGVVDAWERHVRVAGHDLAAARYDVENAGAGRLLLDVKDDVRLDVVVERTVPTKYGYSLSGRVGKGGTGGFVTLVVHGEAVAGAIWTPSAQYELLPLGGGLHSLRDVTNVQFECGSMPQSELNLSAGVRLRRSMDDATNTVVDILVVYTQAAEERVQREQLGDYAVDHSSLDSARTWIEAFNDLAVVWANDAFERSGAFISLNLVGIERIDYRPETLQEDSGVLQSEDVRNLRDRTGADLVHATVGCCFGAALEDGLSYLTIGSHVNFVAHEIGHNFGIGHERHEFAGSGGVRGYRHGFTTADCVSTIMSYHTACLWRGIRQPFFASPWRYSPRRNGRSLGVTRFSKVRGARGPADAVLTLNRNRYRIADYRPSRAEK